MIETITHTFPRSAPGAQEFFQDLTQLLQELSNADLSEEGIRLRPAIGRLATVFMLTDVVSPQLHIGDDSGLRLSVGALSVNGAEGAVPTAEAPSAELHLSMGEVHKKLHGHLVRLDHTGVNFPAALVLSQQWETFVQRLAGQTNLYNYPTGDPWLFILPATEAEFGSDITEFPSGREPKFELVHDAYTDTPAIQIDIETDLSREEVERLFPEPYGVSFPSVADYFRTVYVQHPWPGLDIRFDVRFKNEEPGDSWETGEWLVTAGGRIIGAHASE